MSDFNVTFEENDQHITLDFKEAVSTVQPMTEDVKQALLQMARKVAYIDDDGQNYYSDLYDALYAVTAIRLNTNSIMLTSIGSTQQLTATTTPAGGTVTWASSNTSIATVSNTGLVTSVGYGSCTITASSGSVSATCAVAVSQATLTSIAADYRQSGTVYDTASLDSLKNDLTVTATYSDSSTATVTEYTLSGTLTVGTSTITVSYGGKTTTFTVTVTENRQIPTSYTWLYDARQGELLSERTDLVTPTIQSGCTETLVDGLLHLFVPRGSNNLIRYRLVQETNTNAKLTAKVKFESINYAEAGTALRLQVSNGTNGAQIFERYNKSSYKFGTFEGTTYTEQLSLELNTWYIISVERNNGKQIVTVDGNEILNSSTLSSNYCTSNAIFLQNAGGSISVYDTNVDIDWITYKNND